jgi:hypothetical protein
MLYIAKKCINRDLYNSTRCHERQRLGLEEKAKVEGSQLRLYKAKEGRRRKEGRKPPKYPWGALTL